MIEEIHLKTEICIEAIHNILETLATQTSWAN